MAPARSPGYFTSPKSKLTMSEWATDSAKRRPGGQTGHRGTGLERVAVPDRSEQVEPSACGGCGGGLGAAVGRVASVVQVFDIPKVAVQVTEYLMMVRTCGCGHVTTAPPPSAVSGGPTCYRPNVIARRRFWLPPMSWAWSGPRT
jgi:transposase